MTRKTLVFVIAMLALALGAAMHRSDALYASGEVEQDMYDASESPSLIEMVMEADIEAELDAELEAELKVNLEVAAEADADAEVDVDVDVEEEAEFEAEEETEDAPAANATAAPAALNATAVPATAALNATAAPAPALNATLNTTTPIGTNVTIPGLGSVNVTANPELKAFDKDDEQRVMYLAIHDGRAGSVKPLIPTRKGEQGSAAELAKIAQETALTQQKWEQRAADEQRTRETAEYEILRASGMLPPPVTEVPAKVGIPSKDVPHVMAGTDLEPKKEDCNTTLITAPTPEVPLTEMLLN